MMSCTGNRDTICWRGILFLGIVTMMLVYPVISLEESFCAGTGYYNLNYRTQYYSIRGYRSIGWDRLYAVDKPFTSFFWGAKSHLRPKDNNPEEEIRFVRTGTHSMVGWFYINIQRLKFPFHFVAVWAVTERNEAYGTFILQPARFSISCVESRMLYTEPYAFIPCSAGPVNVETVPNMFIYANLERSPGKSSSASFVEGRVFSVNRGRDAINLLWRSPPQTYCNRPRKFQFIFAYTPKPLWDKWSSNWGSAMKPAEGMWHQGNIDAGPIVHTSPWVYPEYYGHPTSYDPGSTLSCGAKIPFVREDWINKFESLSVDNKWYSAALYPDSSTIEGDFSHSDVIHRSTCKGDDPSQTALRPFGGRCTMSAGGNIRVTASSSSTFECVDRNEHLGVNVFMVSYHEYMDKFKKKMENDCECRIIANSNSLIIDISATQQISTMKTIGGRSRILAKNETEKDKLRSRNKEIFRHVQDETQYTVTAYKRDHDVCSTEHVNLSSKAISDKGGVCVQTPVGKLVYGVRQWHGLTSLGVSLVVTPLSIFIARYHKGDMVLEEGNVQVRPWYLAHILLLFPAIWMYASGMATMGRQTDVIGHSLTVAAKSHRIIGVVTIALIPMHVITGFLRPLNIISRRVVIFVHWFVGILQHVLEIMLCCTAFLIPASPTSATSIFSPHFGVFHLHNSFESKLVFGWFVFSILFHILQTVRVKRRDRRNGVDSRSVFPVIIPQFSRFEEELIIDTEQAEPVILADDVQDLWFERGSLLIFGLVSSIVFVVAVVSLYQELHENLYYGFGPMSCTHTAEGKFIPASMTGNTTDHHKMEITCML